MKKIIFSVLALLLFSFNSFANEANSKLSSDICDSEHVATIKADDSDCYLVTIQTTTLYRNLFMAADDPEAYEIHIQFEYQIWCFD